jgi:VanZ family protein
MKFVYLGISILFTGFIFSMSAATGTESASLSLELATWAESIIERIVPTWNVDLEFLHLAIRKTAHFGEYFLLGISYALTFRAFRLPVWSLIVAGLAVALLDEFSQTFSEGRGPSVVDALVFDFPGYVIGGLLTVWIIPHRLSKNNAS